jgi:hypothetical protein
MPDKVRINGVDYDATNAPPWFNHFVAGDLTNPKTMETARRNYVRNLRGSDLENVILWSIVGLFAVALVWLIIIL